MRKTFKEEYFSEAKSGLKTKYEGETYVFTEDEIKNAFRLARSKEVRFKNRWALIQAVASELNVEPEILNRGAVSFIKKGYIVPISGRKVDIGEIDAEDAEDAGEIETSKTKISSLNQGKATKLKIPKTKKGGKLEEFMRTIIYHMNGSAKGKLLLTGDPGVGKTNKVKNVVSALGLQIITIEVPHISEDELITIPYLVKRGDIEEKFEFQMTGNFEVVNAESSLISKLKRTKKVRKEELDKFLNKNKIFKELSVQFTKLIGRIQEKYKTVLLVDEFYRSSDKRIMNIMRTVLDGNIGSTPIPADVYIIFASNMDNTDGSLADIPENHQFQEIEFDTPSREDWLRYMADKYTNYDVDTGEKTNDIENPISELVYNAFSDNLTDDDLGVKDTSTEALVRVSPRRWDEIMKTISANLPCKDLAEAQQLITFLHTNMTDIYTKETHTRYKKWREVLVKLIEESSGLDANNINPSRANDWEDNLDFQIKTKLKLGKERKYVPLVGGLPGIGKTTLINNLGTKYNLKVIRRDVSTITDKDDVIGLAIQSGQGQDSTTIFSEPPLYKEIMKQYDPSLKPVGDSKYTHILFLDEFTRTKVDVFNAIRSVLLEGKVGNMSLPEDMLVIGAMNPTGKGTIVLPDHTKDVVDFIEAEADYQKLLNYFRNNNLQEKYLDYYGFDMNDIIINLHNEIVLTHQSDYDIEGEEITDINTKKWWWKITGTSPAFYISPRIMDDMISGSLLNIYSKLEGELDYNKNNNYSSDDIASFVEDIRAVIYKQYDITTSMSMKYQSDSDDDDRPTFLMSIEKIIFKYSDKIANGFLNVKSKNINYLIDLVGEYGENIEDIWKEDSNQETIDILTNSIKVQDIDEATNDIINIIRNYINSEITTSDKVVKLRNLYRLFKLIDFTKLDSQIISEVNNTIWYSAIKVIIDQSYNDEEDISGLVGKLDEEPTNEFMEDMLDIYNNVKNDKDPSGMHGELFRL